MGTTFHMYCKDCDESLDLGKFWYSKLSYSDLLEVDLEHKETRGTGSYIEKYVNTSSAIHKYIYKHSGHRIYYFTEHNPLWDYFMSSCTLEKALKDWTYS